MLTHLFYTSSTDTLSDHEPRRHLVPSLSAWRIQQTAEIPTPALHRRLMQSCLHWKAPLAVFFFFFSSVHPKTILSLDPNPVPFPAGHKDVPAPSSQLALETHSSTRSTKPSTEVVLKHKLLATKPNTKGRTASSGPDVCLGLVSLLKASWTKLANNFSATQRLRFICFCYQNKKGNKGAIMASTNFRFRFCSSFEWEGRSETLGWGCSVNPQIDLIRWKLESLFSSIMWLDLHQSWTLMRAKTLQITPSRKPSQRSEVGWLWHAWEENQC